MTDRIVYAWKNFQVIALFVGSLLMMLFFFADVNAFIDCSGDDCNWIVLKGVVNFGVMIFAAFRCQMIFNQRLDAFDRGLVN